MMLGSNNRSWPADGGDVYVVAVAFPLLWVWGRSVNLQTNVMPVFVMDINVVEKLNKRAMAKAKMGLGDKGRP